MQKFITRRSWITLGCILIILVFYASLFPVPQPKFDFRHMDKVHHFVSYALLMLWFSQVYRGNQRILLLIVLITIGIIIEFIQPHTGRMFDPLDMLANISGVLVAWFASLKGADILYHRLK